MSTNIIPPSPANPTATDGIAEPSVLSDCTFPRHSTRRQFLQVAAVATLSSMALSGCGWTLSEVRSQPTSQASSKMNEE